MKRLPDWETEVSRTLEVKGTANSGGKADTPEERRHNEEQGYVKVTVRLWYIEEFRKAENERGRVICFVGGGVMLRWAV